MWNPNPQPIIRGPLFRSQLRADVERLQAEVKRNREALDYYEGALRWSPDSSSIPGRLIDARYDANPMTLYELRNKGDYWSKNSGLASGAGRIYCQYTVGACGMSVEPCSSSEAWNDAARDYLAWWAKFCSLDTTMHLPKIQWQAASNHFHLGETFIAKILDPPPSDAYEDRPDIRRTNVIPKIKLFETHKISTPPEQVGNDLIFDGIQADLKGRVTGYWGRSGMDINGTVYTSFKRGEMYHLGQPNQPGLYHQLPYLFTCDRDLHHWEDLMQIESKAAVENSIIARYGINPEGEWRPEDLTGLDQTQVEARLKEKKSTANVITLSSGVKVPVYKSGTELKQLEQGRPSEATRELWDRLVGRYCAGTGIPKLLLTPESMQGTVVRADLDNADVFFQSEAENNAACWENIAVWVLRFGIQTQDSLSNPPADWWRVEAQFPRSIVVDFGRTEAAKLAALAGGTTTYEAEYANYGMHARRQLRKRIREQFYIAKEIQDGNAEFQLEEPLKRSEVCVLPGTVQTPPPAPMPDPTETPEDDEPLPVKKGAKPQPGKPNPEDRIVFNSL